jgi:hypothetical protein
MGRNYLERYREIKAEENYREALEEFSNDVIGSIFSTEDGIKEYMDWLKEDSGLNAEERKSIIQRIADFFRDLYESIKSYVDNHSLQPGTEKVLNASAEKLHEIRQNVIKVWDEAIENSYTGEEGEVAPVQQENKRFSVPNYSYEELINLPDMELKSVEKSGMKQIYYSPELTRGDILSTAHENIKRYNESEKGDVLYNKQIGNVTIGNDGLRHAFNRLNKGKNTARNISATINIPLYFENAIKINEADGLRNEADKAYILIGAYWEKEDLYITRVVVNSTGKEIEEVKCLYALNAKKEDVASEDARENPITPSSIKIAQLLEYVKKYFPNELSEDVARKMGVTREKSDIQGLRFSLSVDSVGRSLTEEQKKFFADESPLLLTADGALKRYYHGTARVDRVGTVFDPERATSDPMAFFTDNQEIENNYARDKKDTSLAYDTRYDTYFTQFRTTIKGKEMSVLDAWYKLPAQKRNEILEKAQHITFDEDGKEIVYDEDIDYGRGDWDSYLLRENKNNALRALTESWLETGVLSNREADFSKVLEMAGFDEEVTYYDPEARNEGTYEVYIHAANPFDTSNMSDEMIENIREASKNAKTKATSSADEWDKNNLTPEEWMEKFENSLKEGDSKVWTRIPDWVTDTLKENGYDAIVDTGGKYSKNDHQVVIPFASNQVKNIDNESPTENPDIRYSLELDEAWQEIMDEEYEKGVHYSDMPSIIEAGFASLQNVEIDEAAVKKISRELLRKYASSYKTEDLTENIKRVFAYMKDMQEVKYDDLVRVMQEVARPAMSRLARGA